MDEVTTREALKAFQLRDVIGLGIPDFVLEYSFWTGLSSPAFQIRRDEEVDAKIPESPCAGFQATRDGGRR
jgi:hypothetical protein